MFECEEAEPERVGEILAALAGPVPPGPAAVAVLAGIDPLALTGAEQVNLLIAWERHNAWAAAQQASVLASMDHPTDKAVAGPAGRPELVPGAGDPDWTELEVAAALRLSPGGAAHRLEVARRLSSRLPGTRAALAGGRISYWHAVRVVEATMPLTAVQAAAVESRVLPKAAGQTVGALRRSLRRAVIAADPAGAQDRHAQAATERRVSWWELPDGMAELSLIASAADVLTVHTALTALADRPRPPADHRPIGTRRADALIATFHTMLTAGTDSTGSALPTRHGQRPHVHVTVAATTLLGLDQQPAELTGYGPITAQAARTLAADGTWRRIIHDPADGHLLHYGRTTYTPPADLQRHIIARDRTCTFPHCTQPAHRCDIDHAIAWDNGGTTDPHNCHPLCRRHHRAKTHGGWHLTRNPDHTSTWTSPTGHTYTVHPPPYGDHP